MDIYHAITHFQATLAQANRSSATLTNVAAELRLYDRWLTMHSYQWDEVTTEQMSAHLQDFDATHSLARNRIHRTYLARFYGYARQRRWVSTPPHIPVGRPRKTFPSTGSSYDDFVAAVERYGANESLGTYSHGTVRQYRFLLLRFGEHLREKRLNFRTLTTAQLREFLLSYRDARIGPARRDSRYRERRSQTTLALMRSCLRSFYRWLSDEEGCANPAINLRAIQRDRPKPRFIDDARIADLLDQLAHPTVATPVELQEWHRNRLIIVLLLFTGMRLSEAASVRWDRFDWQARTVRVIRKGGAEGVIALHSYLCAELQSFRILYGSTPDGVVFRSRNGSALTAAGISEMFRRFVVTRLGHQVTAHQLRHTFATTLIRRRVPLEVIQRALGHKSIQTTLTYAHLIDTSVHEMLQHVQDEWCLGGTGARATEVADAADLPHAPAEATQPGTPGRQSDVTLSWYGAATLAATTDTPDPAPPASPPMLPWASLTATQPRGGS